MAIEKDKALVEAFKNTPALRQFSEWIERELAQERDIYESQPATEGQRQRVLVLRELLDALKE